MKKIYRTLVLGVLLVSGGCRSGGSDSSNTSGNVSRGTAGSSGQITGTVSSARGGSNGGGSVGSGTATGATSYQGALNMSNVTPSRTQSGTGTGYFKDGKMRIEINIPLPPGAAAVGISTLPPLTSIFLPSDTTFTPPQASLISLAPCNGLQCQIPGSPPTTYGGTYMRLPVVPLGNAVANALDARDSSNRPISFIDISCSPGTSLVQCVEAQGYSAPATVPPATDSVPNADGVTTGTSASCTYYEKIITYSEFLTNDKVREISKMCVPDSPIGGIMPLSIKTTTQSSYLSGPKAGQSTGRSSTYTLSGLFTTTIDDSKFAIPSDYVEGAFVGLGYIGSQCTVGPQACIPFADALARTKTNGRVMVTALQGSGTGVNRVYGLNDVGVSCEPTSRLCRVACGATVTPDPPASNPTNVQSYNMCPNNTCVQSRNQYCE